VRPPVAACLGREGEYALGCECDVTFSFRRACRTGFNAARVRYAVSREANTEGKERSGLIISNQGVESGVMRATISV